MNAALIETILDAMAALAVVTLATVLTVSGLIKFRSLRSTANEFAELGLGRSPVLPAIVAVAEIGAATALIVRPPLGAALAAGLLVAFTGVVTLALAGGKQVSCGCFGPLSREPVSSATVVRNIALLALAVAAGSRSTLIIPDLASVVLVSVAGLTAVVMVQAAMTAHKLGRLWSVELAGEIPREAPSREALPREAPSREVAVQNGRNEQ